MTVTINLRDAYFGLSTFAMEAYDLLIGDHIGTGAFRQVYHHGYDNGLVVKVGMHGGDFHNVTEWHDWNRMAKLSAGKFLVPCCAISPCGTFLVQRYAPDCLESELPTQVPGFMTDMAPRNWGKWRKKVLCRDYGNIQLELLADLPMREANWRLKATKVKDP